MSNLKNNYGSSRVQSNLLQQNCFVRDVTRKVDLGDTPKSSEGSYVSLDEVTTSTGVEIRRTVEPYPITPQYVSSFAESSDYRKDPFSAITNGIRRKNLGDIVDVQRVAGMDMSSAQELYARLKVVFDANPSDAKSVDAKPADSISLGGNDNV